MTRFALRVLGAVLACGSSDEPPTGASAPDRPNILILVADDFVSEEGAKHSGE